MTVDQLINELKALKRTSKLIGVTRVYIPNQLITAEDEEVYFDDVIPQIMQHPITGQDIIIL